MTDLLLAIDANAQIGLAVFALVMVNVVLALGLFDFLTQRTSDKVRKDNNDAT